MSTGSLHTYGHCRTAQTFETTLPLVGKCTRRSAIRILQKTRFRFNELIYHNMKNELYYKMVYDDLCKKVDAIFLRIEKTEITDLLHVTLRSLVSWEFKMALKRKTASFRNTYDHNVDKAVKARYRQIGFEMDRMIYKHHHELTVAVKKYITEIVK